MPSSNAPNRDAAITLRCPKCGDERLNVTWRADGGVHTASLLDSDKRPDAGQLGLYFCRPDAGQLGLYFCRACGAEWVTA